MLKILSSATVALKKHKSIESTRKQCQRFMTIDSGWAKILKTNVPKAFQKKPFAKGGTVFIDGQVKLMKPEYIKTWNLFVQKQFIDTIDRMFLEHDARVVVVGFDNYAYVPRAKNMTQRKRSLHVPDIRFNEHDNLPPVIPDRWDAAMRNRSFKTKVVSLVKSHIRQHYANYGDRTVVIDHVDDVEVIGKPWQLPDIPNGRGECDVKAFAYASVSHPLLIVSTDGDFIPLGLAQCQTLKNSLQDDKHSEEFQNSEDLCPQISLLRLTTRVEKNDSAGKKREYEFVSIPLLLTWVQKQFPKSEDPVTCFCAMVACTGCDFSMNLPQIGPQRMWSARHTMNLKSIQGPADILVMICKAYVNAFKNKARVTSVFQTPEHQQYTLLLERLQASQQISARTRDAMWSVIRAEAHAMNTFWTVLYWTKLQNAPDPLDGNFGFTEHKGKTHFVGDESDSTNQTKKV